MKKDTLIYTICGIASIILSIGLLNKGLEGQDIIGVILGLLFAGCAGIAIMGLTIFKE